MEIGTQMIKHNWKFLTISSILTGLLYVGILMLIDYWLNGGLQSVNIYLFQGTFFGIFMGIFYPFVIGKFAKNIKPELEENEQIEIEGPANLFTSGFIAVGGKIFLTDKKFIFKSRKKSQTNIEYENILEIIGRNSAKLRDNGIRIKTKDGKEFDFVVNEREKWIENLNRRIK